MSPAWCLAERFDAGAGTLTAVAARGELLCQAYEAYRGLIPEGLITFEHAVFLLTTLVRADELLLGGCRDCGAVLVTDRWTLRAPRCGVCGPPGVHGADRAALERGPA